MLHHVVEHEVVEQVSMGGRKQDRYPSRSQVEVTCDASERWGDRHVHFDPEKAESVVRVVKPASPRLFVSLLLTQVGPRGKTLLFAPVAQRPPHPSPQLALARRSGRFPDVSVLREGAPSFIHDERRNLGRSFFRQIAGNQAIHDPGELNAPVDHPTRQVAVFGPVPIVARSDATRVFLMRLHPLDHHRSGPGELGPDLPYQDAPPSGLFEFGQQKFGFQEDAPHTAPEPGEIRVDIVSCGHEPTRSHVIECHPGDACQSVSQRQRFTFDVELEIPQRLVSRIDCLQRLRHRLRVREGNVRHPDPTEGCLPNVRGEQVALRQRLEVKRLIHLQKCVGGTVSSLLEPRFDLQIEFCAGIVGVGEVGEVPVRLLQPAFATSWNPFLQRSHQSDPM